MSTPISWPIKKREYTTPLERTSKIADLSLHSSYSTSTGHNRFPKKETDINERILDTDPNRLETPIRTYDALKCDI